MSRVQSVAITNIQFSERNPRTDAADDLQELSVSMGSGEKLRQAQLPSVVALPDGGYRLIDGERRLRALQERGEESVEVVVLAVDDPLEEHTLRLLANTHHRPLHPLDRATGLMISYLCANADARALGTQARSILADASPTLHAIAQLQKLLAENDWNLRKPDVKWQELLDSLGIEMDPSRRKQLIRLLGLQPELVGRVRSLNLREPSLRALASMSAADQQRLVTELEVDATLETHTRHVARMIKMGVYRSIDDALATIRGEVADFFLGGFGDGDSGHGFSYDGPTNKLSSGGGSGGVGEDGAESDFSSPTNGYSNADRYGVGLGSGFRDHQGYVPSLSRFSVPEQGVTFSDYPDDWEEEEAHEEGYESHRRNGYGNEREAVEPNASASNSHANVLASQQKAPQPQPPDLAQDISQVLDGSRQLAAALARIRLLATRHNMEQPALDDQLGRSLLQVRSECEALLQLTEELLAGGASDVVR